MPTTSRAAVLWEIGDEWKIEEVTLDDPLAGDVLVKMAYAGMCHSDEHAVTGDLPLGLPVIGGHEGSGIVEAVGPGVTSVAPGDHVSMSFIPSCGRCRWCSTGRQFLCDEGAKLFDIGMMSDGREAHHVKGQPVGRYAQIGSFSEYTLISENSVVRVEPDLPLDVVALVSCGVATGFGSATERAGTKPGDNVAVIGIGGIGINAVQGARAAGAKRVIAIDPVEFKREQATKFGATHTASNLGEAFGLIQELTWGRMCDKIVCAVGVGQGDQMAPIMQLCAKRGRVVVTNIHSANEGQISISLCDLTLMEKQIVGTIFGSANPNSDIPRLMHLYRSGQLDLAGMVTREYALEDINQGFDDMLNGRNIRGVLRYR